MGSENFPTIKKTHLQMNQGHRMGTYLPGILGQTECYAETDNDAKKFCSPVAAAGHCSEQ